MSDMTALTTSGTLPNVIEYGLIVPALNRMARPLIDATLPSVACSMSAAFRLVSPLGELLVLISHGCSVLTLSCICFVITRTYRQYRHRRSQTEADTGSYMDADSSLFHFTSGLGRRRWCHVVIEQGEVAEAASFGVDSEQNRRSFHH